MSRRPDSHGIALGLITILALGLVLYTGADLRRFSNALGVAVFGLLLWRLASTWDRLTVLEHALALLLASAPLVGALASLALIGKYDGALQANPWIWLVVAHRCACVVLVIWWTRWLGRRHSPFKRTPQKEIAS